MTRQPARRASSLVEPAADEQDRGRLQAELSVLLTALWFEIDHHDGSRACDFFTPDAELTFSRATFRGHAEIARVYGDRAARGRRTSRHLLTGLHLVSVERDAVQAVSVLVLHAQDGPPPSTTTAPVLVADVHDRLVRVPAPGAPRRWAIAHRRVEPVFLAPGQVLAVPTEQEQQ